MSQKDIQITPESARRLGDSIIRKRVERGYRSARKLGLETDLDYRTITNLESGRRTTVSRSTLAVLEIALELPPGCLTDIAEGNEGPTRGVELSVPPGIPEKEIEQARMIAQAAFNAALEQVRGKSMRIE